MNGGEMKRLEKALRDKEAELALALRRRDGIEIEAQPDTLDEVQRAVERDMLIDNLDRGSATLRQVRSALRRMHDGTYGICTHCEEEISSKRLAAVPWAALCIRCQEEADRNGQCGGRLRRDGASRQLE